jgi:hypothetical protein
MTAEPSSGWTCPECNRMFGRSGQGHDCAPGLSLEEYFETGPSHERPVFDAVMAHVRSLGPVHADVVSVGIFLKNPHKFAEVRPMQRWVAVSFSLDRVASHPAITRKVIPYGAKFWHTANVATRDDLDEALLELLTEAYHLALANR